MTPWLKTFLHKLVNIFTVRRVVGSSMEPNFKNGQIVKASSLLQPKKGRVVVVKVDTKEVIKRVSNVSGEKVFLVGDNASPHHNMTVQATQIRGVVI